MNTALLRQSRACTTTRFGEGYGLHATNFSEWWALYYNGPYGSTNSIYPGSLILAFQDASGGKPRVTCYSEWWPPATYEVPV